MLRPRAARRAAWSTTGLTGDAQHQPGGVDDQPRVLIPHFGTAADKLGNKLSSLCRIRSSGGTAARALTLMAPMARDSHRNLIRICLHPKDHRARTGRRRSSAD